MRHLGNKNSIPSGHPQGNKPSFAGGGPHGRAASSQQASGGGFQGGVPYQQGAPSPPKKAGPPAPVKKVPSPPPFAKDMQENKARLRTTQPFGLPAIKRRMGS